jgi:hypothetical protein
MKTRRSLTLAIAMCTLAASVSPPAHALPDNRPTLELFPSPVLDNLRRTASSAQSLETGLEGVLRDLDLKYQVYVANRCGSGADTAGCQDIEKGLRQSYQQMLDRMIEALPGIEQQVEATRRNLTGTLRSQIGLRLSPRDLQRVVSNRPATAGDRGSGGRIGRLSQQFQRYYDLVSRGRGQESAATMAASIYLDSTDALEWIRLARQDMEAARTELEISLAWGGFNAEMAESVQNVKGLLFGETPALPDAPARDARASDANVLALELN